MRIQNPVKKALSEQKVMLGTWIQLGHPGIAEVLANVGFDWIAVDCEHTDISIENFTSIARAMYARGPVPLARVRNNDVMAIWQVLDVGAQGVIRVLPRFVRKCTLSKKTLGGRTSNRHDSLNLRAGE